MIIHVKKLSPEAKLPEYKSAGAAGADVFAFFEDQRTEALMPGETAIVGTGLAVEVPDGYELQVRSRSGLAAQGLVVANAPGTIDSDYRGEIKIILRNAGLYIHKLKTGDRIAQLVLQKVEQINWIETKSLSETERGENGFGSTGTI